MKVQYWYRNNKKNRNSIFRGHTSQDKILKSGYTELQTRYALSKGLDWQRQNIFVSYNRVLGQFYERQIDNTHTTISAPKMRYCGIIRQVSQMQYLFINRRMILHSLGFHISASFKA